MIPQTFIDDIQAKTDIAELVSSYLPLKRAGKNFKACCPFHGEKTASFIVSPQKQIFHCFGCGEGGGVLQFVMRMEKLTFVESVDMLAKRLGMPVPFQHQEREGSKTVLYDAVNEASLFFHQNLLTNVHSAKAREYLKNRGIGIEEIKQFRLGFAFGKNTLIQHLRDKGISLEMMEKASLIIAGKDGFRDLFCSRIMFPIFDLRSRVVGFGGRIWQTIENVPKYLNSLENPLYSKREHLYGFHLAKEGIMRSDAAIIVEGYLDMLIPFSAGVKNIVASLGTALTHEQIKLINRYTSNVVLVYDADKAGTLATVRALDVLLESNMKVTIARLPAGYDPDLFVRERGVKEFVNILEGKLDFFDYKIDLLTKIHNKESIGGKEKIAKDLFISISKLKSEIERYEYIKKLARYISVSEEVLIAEYKKLHGVVTAPGPKGLVAQTGNTFNKTTILNQRDISTSAASNAMPLTVTEKIILKYLFTEPKAFAIIKKHLSHEDFVSPLAKEVIYLLFEKYSGETESDFVHMIGCIEDTALSGAVAKILLDESIPMGKDFFKSSIQKLRLYRVRQMRNNLKKEIKDAETQGDNARLKKLIFEYDAIRVAKE